MVDNFPKQQYLNLKHEIDDSISISSSEEEQYPHKKHVHPTNLSENTKRKVFEVEMKTSKKYKSDNFEVVKSDADAEVGRDIEWLLIYLYKCVCGVHYMSRNTVQKHFEICRPSSDRLTENCKKCGHLFDKKTLFEHLSKHHNVKQVEFEVVDVENVYKCGRCQKLFCVRGDLQRHFKMTGSCNPSKTSFAMKCSDYFAKHCNVFTINEVITINDMNKNTTDMCSEATEKKHTVSNSIKKSIINNPDPNALGKRPNNINATRSLNVARTTVRTYKKAQKLEAYLSERKGRLSLPKKTDALKEDILTEMEDPKPEPYLSKTTKGRLSLPPKEHLLTEMEDPIDISNEQNLTDKSDLQPGIYKNDHNKINTLLSKDEAISNSKVLPAQLFKCGKCSTHFNFRGSLECHLNNTCDGIDHVTGLKANCDDCGLTFSRVSLPRHQAIQDGKLHYKYHNEMLNLQLKDFVIFQKSQKRRYLKNSLDNIYPAINDESGNENAIECSTTSSHKEEELDTITKNSQCTESKDENNINFKRYYNVKSVNSRVYKQPMQSAISKYIFECTECLACCLTEHTYKKHIQRGSHYVEKDLAKCPICMYAFSSRVLNRHILVHHTEMKLARKDIIVIRSSKADREKIESNANIKSQNNHIISSCNKDDEDYNELSKKVITTEGKSVTGHSGSISRFKYDEDSKEYHRFSLDSPDRNCTDDFGDILDIDNEDTKEHLDFILDANNLKNSTADVGDISDREDSKEHLRLILDANNVESDADHIDGISSIKRESDPNEYVTIATRSLNVARTTVRTYKKAQKPEAYLSERKGRLSLPKKTGALEEDILTEMEDPKPGPYLSKTTKGRLSLPPKEHLLTEMEDPIDISNEQNLTDKSDLQPGIYKNDHNKIDTLLSKDEAISNSKVLPAQLFKCGKCSTHFNFRGSLECHLNNTCDGIDHVTGLKANCDDCGLTFSRVSLPRHQAIHHGKLHYKYHNEMLNLQLKDFVIFQKSKKRRYLNNSLDNIYPAINDESGNENAIECSTTSSHKEEELDTITKNSQCTESKDENNVNFKRYCNIKRYYNLKSVKSRVYKQPMQGAVSKFIFECTECLACCLTERTYEKHIQNRSHYVAKDLAKCPICMYAFSSRILNRHILVHHTEMKLARKDIIVIRSSKADREKIESNANIKSQNNHIISSCNKDDEDYDELTKKVITTKGKSVTGHSGSISRFKFDEDSKEYLRFSLDSPDRNCTDDIGDILDIEKEDTKEHLKFILDANNLENSTADVDDISDIGYREDSKEHLRIILDANNVESDTDHIDGISSIKRESDPNEYVIIDDDTIKSISNEDIHEPDSKEHLSSEINNLKNCAGDDDVISHIDNEQDSNELKYSHDVRYIKTVNHDDFENITGTAKPQISNTQLNSELLESTGAGSNEDILTGSISFKADTHCNDQDIETSDPKVHLYKCDKCFAHFLRLKVLFRHLRIGCTGRKSMCPLCGLYFSRWSIQQHINLHHLKLKLRREDFVIMG